MKKSDESNWKYFFKTIVFPNFLLIVLVLGIAVAYFYFVGTTCIDKCVAEGENMDSCMAICD